MGSPHPSRYKLFKLRVTFISSKYWIVRHTPQVDPNQDPTEVSFIGKSMPTPVMAIEVAAYGAVTRLQFMVPYASERGYYYFPE